MISLWRIGMAFLTGRKEKANWAYCKHGSVLFPTWHRVYIFMSEVCLNEIFPMKPT